MTTTKWFRSRPSPIRAVLCIVVLTILFVHAWCKAGTFSVTPGKHMTRSTSGSNSSVTDTIQTTVSSDPDYTRNGMDSASFTYRYRGQASARGTGCEAGTQGYLSYSFTLPPAIWTIRTQVNYSGVVAVSASGAGATFSNLVLSSTDSASGFADVLAGLTRTSEGGRTFDRTADQSIVTTTTGSGSIRLSFEYGAQSTGTVGAYASLGQMSPLDPFALDNTWYDENDGVLTTLTFTPSLDLTGQSVNWDLAMVSGEILSGYGTVNGNISGVGTIHPTGAGLILGNPASNTGFSFSGNVEVISGDLEICDTDEASIPSGGVSIANGHVLTVGRLQCNCPITLDSGSLILASQTGTGPIQNALGTMQSRWSPQNVEIHSAYTQQPHGTLLVKVGNSGQSDSFIFQGATALDGVLRVDALPGFAVVDGATYRILNFAGGRTGTFSGTVLPTLGGGYSWDTSRLYSNGEIKVVYEYSGRTFEMTWSTLDGGGGTSTGGQYDLTGTIGQFDTGVSSAGTIINSAGFWPGNFGCMVNLEDLLVFAQEWLSRGTTAADLDRSGKVDVGDFAIFSREWMDGCPGDWPLK